ncbi:MAG: Aspartyl/glutamyl-tRNA(Asn/Gln) amidotransferase subunit C [Parcubacteria group bacterium GW2011_GWA2_56_7]|nr:MAG: Aspartyl/glutamyl-tRNA(Asn/Gln) amidotransferase subunit C [Parcubacteria group bacterium GW2011_GWA2_56_7]
MDKQTIHKLADLAKLELSEREETLFAEQLGSILEYVEKLNELDLPKDAPQMSHVTDVLNVWREDEVAEVDRVAEVKDLVGTFPESKGNMNAVPGVFSDQE